MTQQQIIYLALVPFIMWRLYSRMRKLIGRQQARPGKLWMSVILFPLLLLAMAWGCQNDMAALESLAGGAVCGAALAFLGLKLTRFEVEQGQLFYKPNTYIGMGLMMLFVMRIVYRITMAPSAYDVGAGNSAGGDVAMQRLASSPLTLFILGMVFCYYAPYSAGVLLRRSRLGKAAPAENPLL